MGMGVGSRGSVVATPADDGNYFGDLYQKNWLW